MVVAGVTIDPVTKSPIVVLRDPESGLAIPIWIGILEANSIATVLEGTEMPRPMTHDLMKSILEGTGTTVRNVEITEIRDNTYYAAIRLEGKGGPITIDSRPSDAIALALRCGAPIRVSEAVIAQSSMSGSTEIAAGDKDKWTELLEKMDPEQFSKYKM